MKCFFLVDRTKKRIGTIVLCMYCELQGRAFVYTAVSQIDPLEFLIVPITTTPINYIVIGGIGCRLLVYVYVSAYSSP